MEEWILNELNNGTIFQCTVDVIEQMVANTASMPDFENFKSTFDLMKSKVRTCNELPDTETQNK